VSRRRSIGVFIAGFSVFLNLYAVQALLPTLADAFDVPVSHTGWTITAPLLAVALLAPFVGSVSDMLGRKRLIVTAMAILPLPTLLVAFAGSLSTMILWRFVQGLTMPFIFAVTIAYVGEETEGAETIKLAGTYTVGTIFGGFFGRFLAGQVTELSGWRTTFVIFAALTALCCAAAAALVPKETRFCPVAGVAASLRSFADHLTNRRLLATFAVGFSMLFCIIAVFTYVNFYLAAPPFGLGPAALGAVFVVYLLGMVMTPIATRTAVRFGRRATLACATAVCIAALALTLVANLAAIVIGLAFIAGALFVQMALAIGFIGTAARHAKSTAVGLYVACYYVGGAMGGIAPAGLWHWAGWPGCVGLAMTVQLVVVAIATVFWREMPVPVAVG
jgi:MFS transporter, YNFM family, putative membrane transport protein